MITENHKNLIELLLKQKGIDLDVENENKDTALAIVLKKINWFKDYSDYV